MSVTFLSLECLFSKSNERFNIKKRHVVGNLFESHCISHSTANAVDTLSHLRNSQDPTNLR